jgi:ERCC4-type nuclease
MTAATARSSSKKSPSDPLVQVLVDSREPEWVRSLPFGGATVSASLIEVGDVLGLTGSGAAVLIERKTAGDLLASIKDGRLIAQAAAMREVTEWAYLVVTEPMYPGRFGQVLFQPTKGRTLALRETAWGWSSLQGALTTVQDLGVGVVWCGGDDRFEETALWLFSRERGPVAVPRRLGLPLPEGEAILCALPGVGPERARELLRECGSVAWALYALTEVPASGKYKKNVIGVGPKTRLEVRRALGLQEGETLVPLREEPE